MSRQTELMNLSEQLPYVLQKDFIFFFQCYAYEPAWTRLNFTPQGWKGSKWQINRSMKYWGLTRKVSVDTLTFVKDGRDYLQAVYEQVGINADVSFRVWKKDKSTYDWISYFVGRVDMATYKITELGVEVQIVDTSFHEKIMNRINTEVDIRRTDSLGGFTIPPFTSESPKLIMPEIDVYSVANWQLDVVDDTDTVTHYLPMPLIQSDFTEGQTQEIDQTDKYFIAQIYNGSRQYFYYYYVEITLKPTNTMTFEYILNLTLSYGGIELERVAMDFSGSVVAQTIILEGVGVNSYTLGLGQTAYLQGSRANQVGMGDVNYQYDSIRYNISAITSTINQNEVIAYPYYEAMLRVCQLIGDGNNVFKSDYFGRTDTPVVTYGSDGQLGHIARGLFLRNANHYNEVLALSLNDIFDSLNGMFQIGLGIEIVGGKYKVVMENLEYFFNINVTLDLSDVIREENIGKEVIPDLHYNGIKSGYKSFEYERIGGMYEFNTKSLFATTLDAIDNSLDLIVKYRGDTTGIIKLREITAVEEDVKGDEDIFIIDSIRDGSDWLARTDEDFTVVSGGVDFQKYFNLDLTPKRNLLRNGDRIRAGLNKNLGSSLKWQSLDKITDLETRRTVEIANVVENADEVVNDLALPFFLPEKYIVEVPLTAAQITAIDDDPMGIIMLSDTKYGWILNVEIENETGLATMEILRANVTPIP